jgi:hypothetical protein
MVGILVHGDNHFILSGPPPDEASAMEMARHWSIVQIGGEKSARFGKWEIRTEELRENLEWAVIVPAENQISAGVLKLLAEISARGIEIRQCAKGQSNASGLKA